MSNAIAVENLTKSYGKNRVLRSISFSVKRGETYALLGVNVPRYERKKLYIS